MTPRKQFLTFSFANQREREALKDKGLTMLQRIHLNWNNRFVVECHYPTLWEKIGPIFPLLVGLMADRQTGWLADKIWENFKIFKILYRFIKCSDFTLFNKYRHNVTIVLAMHFSQLSSSKAIWKCLLKCEKFGCYSFSLQSLLLSTNVLNDSA